MVFQQTRTVQVHNAGSVTVTSGPRIDEWVMRKGVAAHQVRLLVGHTPKMDLDLLAGVQDPWVCELAHANMVIPARNRILFNHPDDVRDPDRWLFGALHEIGHAQDFAAHGYEHIPYRDQLECEILPYKEVHARFVMELNGWDHLKRVLIGADQPGLLEKAYPHVNMCLQTYVVALAGNMRQLRGLAVQKKRYMDAWLTEC